jgi:hypothetical protein
VFSAGDSETVVRIRPPGKDAYGDPVAGAETELDVTGVLFAPAGSSEVTDGANQVRADGAIYAEPDTDVLATDKLRIRGQEYQVVGAPQQWGSTMTVIAVRRITG